MLSQRLFILFYMLLGYVLNCEAFFCQGCFSLFLLLLSIVCLLNAVDLDCAATNDHVRRGLDSYFSDADRRSFEVGRWIVHTF